MADCSLPRPAHAVAARRRACLECARRRLGRTGEAHPRLDFQRQPDPAGVIDYGCKHRQNSTSLRHIRVLAGLLLTAFGVGIGWLLGGRHVETKRVMALGTGQRNAAAALVVASQSFDDPKVVVMVFVIAVVGWIIFMPLSRALAGRGTIS